MPWGIGPEHFTGRLPALEDHAGWQTVANLFGHLHFADGRAIAGGAVAQSKFGGGYLVDPDRLAIFIEGEFLIRDADPHFPRRLAGRAAGKDTRRDHTQHRQGLPQGAAGHRGKAVD